jgi:hypothetical protein
MDYDQYRPDAPFKVKLALIHVLLQSLSLDSSPVANDGLLVKYVQATEKSGGHYSNRQIVNSGHGL